jgi:hypothetical protein
LDRHSQIRFAGSLASAYRLTFRLKQKDKETVLADESLESSLSKTYDVGQLISEKSKVEEGEGVPDQRSIVGDRVG